MEKSFANVSSICYLGSISTACDEFSAVTFRAQEIKTERRLDGALIRAHDEIGHLYEARLKAASGSLTKLESISQRKSGGYLFPPEVIIQRCRSKWYTCTQSRRFTNRSVTAKENLTLKIGPNVEEEIRSSRLTSGQCYMRALFTSHIILQRILYYPARILFGLKSGDILQIPIGGNQKYNCSSDQIGLIPSQELEERRKLLLHPKPDYVHKIGICGTRISKRKRKTMYRSVANCEFDKAELMLYEEVTRMPPFRRKTLVLIGVSGVGRRTLKNRLVNSDTDRFGYVLPHTTRPKRALEENGVSYWFVDREWMEQEIKEIDF
ncbi:hypothetical protein DOY81_009181 [Sarcophaga bullata]|nr:hypothetical protein DOY81_009181 [Sarcophaga bullata]